MRRFAVFVLIVVALAVGFAGSADAHYQQQSAARLYKHATDVLRFFTNHPTLARTPAGKVAIKNHIWLLHYAEHRLAPVYPPHHQLWLCIHGGEGAWNDPNSGRNGHYGGLQMHPGWGYGTSYYASNDSQATQEWAAEKAYKASDYSSTFLWQQWAADAHCFS